MELTTYIASKRNGAKPPKSGIVERWNDRVVPNGFDKQGRDGATAYLAKYGKGIAAPKLVELALMAESVGATEMANGFWAKAHELETAPVAA